MPTSKTLISTTPAGENIYLCTLDNGHIKAEILSLGGIIKNLYVPDKNNKPIDIVLGYDTPEQYLSGTSYFGAAIGRVGNRIKDGKFKLGDTEYHVGCNDGANSLHGGICGFDKKVWTVKTAEDINSEPTLAITLTSPDGDEGFPGTLEVTVTYTLTKDNGLKIHYEAVTDKDTLVNLTNHSYFNLSGHDSGTIKDNILCLNSSFYTPNTPECMPYGEILSVAGTPFDFREPKPIGSDIASPHEQTKLFGGYDHNLILDGCGMRFAGYAESPASGIRMNMYTDLPGVQLYTSNALDEGIYKGGAHYSMHQAFCLETQYIPNAISYAHYKAPILRKGEKYDTVTIYKFEN